MTSLSVTEPAEPWSERSFGEVPGRVPIVNANVLSVRDDRGREWVVTSGIGSPGRGRIFFIDPHGGEVRWRSVPEGEPGIYAHAMGADGRLYLGGVSGRLYRCGADGDGLEPLGCEPMGGIVWGNIATPGGRVFFFSSPGMFVEWDCRAGREVRRGRLSGDGLYAHTAVHLAGEQILIGLSCPQAQLITLTPGGEPRRLVPDWLAGVRFIRLAGWLGDRDRIAVRLGAHGHERIVIANWPTLEIARRPENPAGGHLGDVLAADGELFAASADSGRVLRLAESGWVDHTDGPPGGARLSALNDGSLISVTREGQMLRHVPAGEPRGIELPADCAGAQSVHGLTAAGNGLLYGSTFINQRFFELDPASGRMRDLGAACADGGQINALAWADGRLFMASYAHAAVLAYDPTRPLVAGENPARVGGLGDEQMRPNAMIACEGRLYVVSNAAYGLLGGALGIVDVATGEIRSHRNIVPEQNLTSLALDEQRGILAGGSTIHADCQSAPPARDCAAVFLWDVRDDGLPGVFPPPRPAEALRVHGVLRDGRVVVSGWPDEAFALFDIDRRRFSAVDAFPLGALRGPLVRVGPDTLMGVAGGRLLLWRESAQSVQPLPNAGGTCLTALPDGDVMLARDGIELVRLTPPPSV